MLVAPYFAKQFYLITKNNFRKFFVAREAVKNKTKSLLDAIPHKLPRFY